ncbi:MAG TPA: PqiC family protein [Geobacteraceae bacterium]|nr:PqiC family protein [Geobacteraceae bacterium]
MTAKRYMFILSVACGILSALSGCFGTSPSARFYTLIPPGENSRSAATGLDRAVSVGPVTIPEYLDRQQIVTRSAGNEIYLAEFDRWGASLDGEITRVLVAGLSERLNSRHFAVYPRGATTLGDSSVAYRIPVSVIRFDGTQGGKVVLDATWGVFVKGPTREEPLFATESTITEDVKGQGYDALVAAMGKAVQKLGNEMADSIMKVDASKSQGR